MEHDAAYRAWVDGGCAGRCPGGEDRAEYTARVCAGAVLCRIGGINVFGEINIGTIITAFFMGPLIAFFNEKLARPFLYGKADR